MWIDASVVSTRPDQLFTAVVLTGMAAGITVLGWAAFGGMLQQFITGARDIVLESKQRGMKHVPVIDVLDSFVARSGSE
jgi:hypothetical protein